MDKKSICYLLSLLHDAAARLEDYLGHDEPKDPVKEGLKDELFLVLDDIQVTTLSLHSDILKEA